MYDEPYLCEIGWRKADAELMMINTNNRTTAIAAGMTAIGDIAG